MNRALITSLAVAAAAAGQSPVRELGSVGQNSAQAVPQLRNVFIEQKLNTLLPLDTEFRTETGRRTQLGEFFGKRPVILAPVYYTCPRLCTMTLTGLLKTARVLPLNVGQEYEIVAFSFDPADSPRTAGAKKLTYVNAYGRAGTSHGWHFLTGSKRDILRLTEALGFGFEYDERVQEYSHASGIMVATPDGRLSRYFGGIEYPARDLRLALVEAGNGKVGSVVDQLLLYCFHYDPSTGKYSATVLGVIRLTGVATLLTVVGFVVVSRTRERRRARRWT